RRHRWRTRTTRSRAPPAPPRAPVGGAVAEGRHERAYLDRAGSMFRRCGACRTFYDVVSPGMSAALNVFSRMSTSLVKLQFSTYERSRRTLSSHDSDERPETCHRPVIPGLTRKRRCTWSSYCSTSRWIGGRGPTRLIEPPSTLNSCGSSSSEYLR